MKRSLIVFPLVALIASCGGEEVEEDVYDDGEVTEQHIYTDAEIDSLNALDQPAYMSEDAYTAVASLDGPDEWFYIHEPEDEGIDFMDEEFLHVIPYDYNNGGDEEFPVEEFMIKLVDNDFELYEPYDDFSGMVRVFYDGSKETPMVEYTVEGGLPDGQVTVYDPAGEIFVNREYDVGKWIGSSKEQACMNWSYRQSECHLMIYDPEFGVEDLGGGSRIITIQQSGMLDKHEDNNLYRIIQKASFEQPFKVSNVVMNGTMTALAPFRSMEPETYWMLNFKDGYLDGDIMIYNDWGELDLHEKFEMGELVETVYKAEYGDGVAKPIIYLYPEEEMNVSVQLQFDGKLTHSYPDYPRGGWEVKAHPNGTLIDESGKEYYALYWEGQERDEFVIDEGFVVKGEETVEFLEGSLEILGLNRREANEFIVYWLPKLENNTYNLIHFSSDQYEEMARLNIKPEPETVIRVMMVYQALDQPIDIPQQNLFDLRKERKGFTVVEWGGTEGGAGAQLKSL